MMRTKYCWVAFASALALACGGDEGTDTDARTDSPDANVPDAGLGGSPNGSNRTADGGSTDSRSVRDDAAVSDAAIQDAAVTPNPGGSLADLPGTTLVDALEAPQTVALCEALAAPDFQGVKNARIALCTVRGLRAAQASGSCDDERARCLQQEPEPDPASATDCDGPANQTCPGLTVSQVNACIATLQTDANTLGSFTCASTLDEIVRANERIRMGSPECAVLASTCRPL